MFDKDQLAWMSNAEVLAAFETLSVEFITRSRFHGEMETPHTVLQRVRAAAHAVAVSSDKALGEQGQPVFVYLTEDQARAKISLEISQFAEVFAKTHQPSTVASGKVLAYRDIVARVANKNY